MFDKKVVRRRRAALAIFVALSIAVLTAYFGESGGGLLHAFQRGTQEAFAPIESGASRALKPSRDLFGWVGDTFDAKGETHVLRRTLQSMQASLSPADFVRVHRSSIVNVARIEEIQPWFNGEYVIVLRDGTKVQSIRGYRARLEALMSS